jgi:hypothetical protein
MGADWDERTLDHPIPTFTNNCNIGILLGEPSGGVVRVDPDFPAIPEVAAILFPEPTMVFGRKSSPRSGRLYTCRGLKTKNFKLPGTVKDDPRLPLHDGKPCLIVLQLLSTGAQTMVPPSVHPECGEEVVWHSPDGAMLCELKPEELTRRAGVEAFLLAVCQFWPARGTRNEAAMALARVLLEALEAHYPNDEELIEAVDDLVVAVAMGGGDGRDSIDGKERAKTTLKKMRAGEETTGMTRLLELLELPTDVAKTFRDWLRASGLPELVIQSSDLTRATKQLAELIAERDDFLFNGFTPVRVAVEGDFLPRALEVTPEAVRILAHEICRPVKLVTTKQGAVEKVPVTLSREIAVLYLNGLEGDWKLKPFHGITTTPILDDSGGVRVASGYDAATGTWCHNVPTLSIPESPKQDEAEAALKQLRHTFRTFPWKDSERVKEDGIEVTDLTKPAGVDESAFLVGLLTGVCRQSLDLAPGFLCNAPALSGSGTGKGLLVKAICIIATGAKPTAFTSGHDIEEFDKRLASALIEARPAVFLDNYNAKELTSDSLASALTENPSMVRPMGWTKMVPLHVRTFISVTGNGVPTAEDMARRFVECRLDARVENPEQRRFKSDNFLEGILAARGSLLSAALTIWRWGRQNKELKAGQPLGSYGTWCRWVRDPLLTLGMKDPVDRITEVKANDPKRRALIEFFDVWWEWHGDNVTKAADLQRKVLEMIEGSNVGTDDKGLMTFNRQKVAGFLGGLDGTRVGGYSFSKTTEGTKSRKTAAYKLEREPEAAEAEARG